MRVPKLTWWLLLAGGGLILLSAYAPSFTRSVSDLVLVSVRPLQFGLNQAGLALSQELRYLGNLRNMGGEFSALKIRTQALEVEASLSKELARENAILREQLGVKGQESLPTGRLFLTRVVGRSEGGGRSFIFVDRGAVSQVAVGQTALLGGALVGMVEEVFPHYAKVRLLTDAESNVAALDQDSPQRARGVVRGRYTTGFRMKSILPRDEVNVGDTIISSGEGGVFPKGLLIGKVTSVSLTEGGLLKEADLEAFLDFSRLEEVFLFEEEG